MIRPAEFLALTNQSAERGKSILMTSLRHLPRQPLQQQKFAAYGHVIYWIIMGRYSIGLNACIFVTGDILLGFQTTAAQSRALLSDKAKNRTF